MAQQRFDLSRVVATPWKNGGGTTQELACWPLDADMEHFDWRVSVATIAQSGPFSRFVGVDRVITLLSGDGVHLRHAETGVDHQLQRPLQPFAFAGDSGLECELLGGPSTDFNLMTRRGRWQGGVQTLRHDTVLPPRPAGLLLAVQGRWTLAAMPADPMPADQAPAVVLTPDTGLWWANAGCSWSLSPEPSDAGAAALLHVVLDRV